ncbi:MAG: hypothetical protein ACJ8AG_04125, partial [Ktedonobacteraceae bacterium]
IETAGWMPGEVYVYYSIQPDILQHKQSDFQECSSFLRSPPFHLMQDEAAPSRHIVVAEQPRPGDDEGSLCHLPPATTFSPHSTISPLPLPSPPLELLLDLSVYIV